MRRSVFLAWLYLMGAVAVLAGEPTLTVQLVPERFGLEDVARLQITVEGGQPEGGAPRPRRLENLQVVGGPSVSRQFSFVNGVSSSAVTYTYLVQASGVGKAVVGPVVVTVDGKELSSGPIETEVVEGSVAPPRRRPPSPFDPFGDLLAPPVRRAARVELRLLPERQEVFRGEPLGVTLALDTTAAVEGFEWATPPSFPGWWSQRVDQNGPLEGRPVEVGGIRFMRYPVGRFVLIPLGPGTLELPPCTARIGLRGGGFFAAPQVVERSTRAVAVRVKELPPAPPGFHGAVGSLRYRARFEPAKVDPGGTATLTVELSGRGNLPLAEPPFPWPAPEGCEIYPPEEDSKGTVTATGPKGRRAWKAVVVPSRSGTFQIAAQPVAVFDPVAGRYRSAVLGPFALEVAAPTPTPVPTPAPRPSPVAGEPAAPSQQERRAPAGLGQPGSPRLLLLLLAVAVVGALAGGGVTLLVLRSRRHGLPRRRSGESPAERARALQGALEGWWHGLDEKRREDPELRRDVERLRRDLEAVRFAPDRADHSETVAELESRLQRLLSSA